MPGGIAKLTAAGVAWLSAPSCRRAQTRRFGLGDRRRLSSRCDKARHVGITSVNFVPHAVNLAMPAELLESLNCYALYRNASGTIVMRAR
jgi:hypothetical protein